MQQSHGLFAIAKLLVLIFCTRVTLHDFLHSLSIIIDVALLPFAVDVRNKRLASVTLLFVRKICLTWLEKDLYRGIFFGGGDPIGRIMTTMGP